MSEGYDVSDYHETMEPRKEDKVPRKEIEKRAQTNEISRARIILDMPAIEYHADPAPISLSSSLAHTLINRSPRHTYDEHPKLGNSAHEEASAECYFGSVCHDLLLSGGKGFSIFDGKTWQGKAAGEFWDGAIADGKTPIKKLEYERAIAAVTAWKAQFPLDVFDPDCGHCESTIIWREANGVNCRARLDFIEKGFTQIWDLKTTSDARPDKCIRKVVNDGLDLRSEFYKRGVEMLHPDLQGRIHFGFVFAETKPPFCISIFGQRGELDGKWKHIGSKKVQRAIDVFGDCLTKNSWPGYECPAQIECPHFQLMKETEEGAEDE